ncbi:MAG: 50S ribosomal protein L24 [Candidatus Pacebacteria bacterium]|nr:50S ribosomal protein L24 [Candidatus Paceibacterota bacterium]
MKIKAKDNVIVISGKDKGKKGKVLRAIPAEDKIVIEGVNVRKKHKKANRKGLRGEIIEFATPIHVSNVMIEDPKTKKPSRVGYKTVNDKKIRIAKKSDSEI